MTMLPCKCNVSIDGGVENGICYLNDLGDLRVDNTVRDLQPSLEI